MIRSFATQSVSLIRLFASFHNTRNGVRERMKNKERRFLGDGVGLRGGASICQHVFRQWDKTHRQEE